MTESFTYVGKFVEILVDLQERHQVSASYLHQQLFHLTRFFYIEWKGGIVKIRSNKQNWKRIGKIQTDGEKHVSQITIKTQLIYLQSLTISHKCQIKK